MRTLPADARQTTFQNVPSGVVILVMAQNANGFGAYTVGAG